jgi:hypothetical protein
VPYLDNYWSDSFGPKCDHPVFGVLHLSKYFGNLSNFISHATPKFQKTLVIDRGNTRYRAYPKQSAYLIQSDIQYPMSESLIMAPYSLDMLHTHIEYHSTDPYDTDTMYHPVDVRWDVLNDIMSSYYLHI